MRPRIRASSSRSTSTTARRSRRAAAGRDRARAARGAGSPRPRPRLEQARVERRFAASELAAPTTLARAGAISDAAARRHAGALRDRAARASRTPRPCSDSLTSQLSLRDIVVAARRARARRPRRGGRRGRAGHGGHRRHAAALDRRRTSALHLKGSSTRTRSRASRSASRRGIRTEAYRRTACSTGEVREIEPLGERVQNVTYFEVEIAVDGSPTRRMLRPRMSGDADIVDRGRRGRGRRAGDGARATGATRCSSRCANGNGDARQRAAPGADRHRGRRRGAGRSTGSRAATRCVLPVTAPVIALARRRTRPTRRARQDVHALRGVDLAIARGRARRDHGPVGLRARRPCSRSSAASRGRPRAATAPRHGASQAIDAGRPRARCAASTIGFVFQASTCCRASRASRTSSCRSSTGACRRAERARARARGARRASGSRARARIGPPSSRAASASASRSRARSSTRRASCSPTSRPATSTRDTGDEILDLLARSTRDGSTVVMVTHDARIAARAARARPDPRRPRSRTTCAGASP